MKMVCHTLDIGFSTNTEGLEIGKAYDIADTFEYYVPEKGSGPSTTYKILVVNIDGHLWRYNSLLFKEISEWRRERLEELGV
jgi:hypothetical protein